MPQSLSSLQLIFSACLFGAVAMIGYVVINFFLKSDRDPLRERLRGSRTNESADQAIRQSSLSPMVQRVSKAVAQPLMPKSREEVSRVRRKFAHAGIYSTAAIQLFVCIKIILCAAGLAFGVLVGVVQQEPMVGAVLAAVGGILGVLLPSLWLSTRISRRQLALQSALPDALDLMVVCVEAGLTIDAAIQRVGHEIALAHPDISRELGITHMETRVGVARIDALRNFGIRTGCSSIQSLSAMLVQAERFGTSIGAALRVHAESLRIKRQYAAEERAAKTTVKLAFPVVLFIFPTVIIVLGGPALILLLKSAMFSH
ncbi:MAG: type II secretion system F family protein [Anaerolineae bacterium]|nr:type II secretion system F family protein [Phycisphaerae bacterium]